MKAKPKINIIGTGGTIAGRSASATDLAYDAAELSVDELLEDIPGLKDIADISATNLFALNSKDMGPGEWLKLARRVESCAEDQDTAGVVVTHGTDTLEEAALFLELTLRTQKPVVITGSMRAATALSADGPANLYQAVQVSASSQAAGRGVLVVLNGEIFSGTRVIKGHSIATDAFSASAGGLIGNAYSGHTFFLCVARLSSPSRRFSPGTAKRSGPTPGGGAFRHCGRRTSKRSFRWRLQVTRGWYSRPLAAVRFPKHLCPAQRPSQSGECRSSCPRG